MAAIGTGWADGAWIFESWILEAWDDEPNVQVAPSGGWIVRDVFETLADRKRRQLEQIKEVQEEIAEIEGVDGEIATLLHKDDEKELIEKSLKDLEKLVKSGITKAQIQQDFNQASARAFVRAKVQGNFSAMQHLEREMDKVREEDDFFLLAMMTLQ